MSSMKITTMFGGREACGRGESSWAQPAARIATRGRIRANAHFITAITRSGPVRSGGKQIPRCERRAAGSVLGEVKGAPCVLTIGSLPLYLRIIMIAGRSDAE